MAFTDLHRQHCTMHPQHLDLYVVFSYTPILWVAMNFANNLLNNKILFVVSIPSPFKWCSPHS